MSAALELGSTGQEVVALQQALLAHGFNPGTIDGEFGSATQQAVLAFQMSKQMLADGIAGPRTQAALDLVQSAALPDATGDMTVQVASRMCPGAQLDAIKANLPAVLDALTALALHDRTMVLMAVATIRAETASFRPISEGLSGFNTSPGGHPFDLYDNRTDLGNRGAPDGASYRGRGFVQLTGRSNYERYGPRLESASQPRRQSRARERERHRGQPARAVPEGSRAEHQGRAPARQLQGGAATRQRRLARHRRVHRGLRAR